MTHRRRARGVTSRAARFDRGRGGAVGARASNDLVACDGNLTLPAIAERLRTALEVVELLGEREAPGTIRAWWIGMSPDLGNEAPALVLHTRPDHVRDAARAFLAE